MHGYSTEAYVARVVPWKMSLALRGKLPILTSIVIRHVFYPGRGSASSDLK